jgi:hypothetical protein
MTYQQLRIFPYRLINLFVNKMVAIFFKQQATAYIQEGKIIPPNLSFIILFLLAFIFFYITFALS